MEDCVTEVAGCDDEPLVIWDVVLRVLALTVRHIQSPRRPVPELDFVTPLPPSFSDGVLKMLDVSSVCREPSGSPRVVERVKLGRREDADGT